MTAGGLPWWSTAPDRELTSFQLLNVRHRFGDGSLLTGTLAGNHTKTTFDRIAGTPGPLAGLGRTTPLFDLTQQLRLSDSLPRTEATLDSSTRADV